MKYAFHNAGSKRWVRALVCAGALAASAAGLAGCGADDGTGGSTTTPTASPSTSAAAPCPAGSWRSTQVAASGSAAGANLSAQGGSGVAVTIGADGSVKGDFGQMQPITFTGQAAGVQVKGEISYSGTVSGTVTLASPGASAPTMTPSTMTPVTGPTTATPMPSPTTTATGAESAWQPTGTVDFSTLAVTVKLTEPASLTVVDNIKVSDVTGAQTTQAGNAVDLQPLLRAGTYRCEGENTLIITPSDSGPTVTWTLERA